MAAGTWSAGTGNWSTGANWDDSNVPSAVPVTLSDVASGTRTVTYNSSNPAVTSLSMTQSTAGATNELIVSGAVLQLQGTATGATQNSFVQTLSGGAIHVSVVSGGEISLSNDTSTSSATKYLYNRGTLNVGDSSTSGSITFTNATSTRGITSRAFNMGVVNLSNAFITRGSNTTSGFAITTGNDGVETNANAELNFLTGTSVLGSVDVASSGNARSQSLTNYGKMTVSNGAVARLNSNVTSGGATAVWTLTNKAGGVLNQGSATVSGNGEIRATSNSNSNTNNFTIINEGTWNTYGKSLLTDAVSSSTAFSITNAAGATWNLVGDTTGVAIGWNRSSDFSMTNSGALNVKRFTGTGGGATGVATFGNFSTTYNSTRSGFTLNASADSELNVDPDAALKFRTRSAANNYKAATLNNSGTFTLGASGNTTGAGSLSLILAIGSGNANSDVADAHSGRFTNSGITRLHGTSSIAIDPASIAVNDAATYVTLFATNNSGASIELYDSSSIGQTGSSTQNSVAGQSDFVGSKPMRTVFNNAGTVTKIGSGAAAILSAAGGTANSAGTIDVQAGSLEFSSALSNDAGGLIKGNGTLITPTLTSVGTIAPGASVGTLGIDGNVAVGDAGSVQIEVVGDTFDVLNVDGDLNLSSLLDTLAVTAAGSQTLTRLPIITYTGALSGVFNTETLSGFAGAASIDYSVTGEIAVVVPEPTTLALAGLAGVGLLRRRRVA